MNPPHGYFFFQIKFPILQVWPDTRLLQKLGVMKPWYFKAWLNTSEKQKVNGKAMAIWTTCFTLVFTPVVEKVNKIQKFSIKNTFLFDLQREVFYFCKELAVRSSLLGLFIYTQKFTGVAVIHCVTKLICMRTSNMCMQNLLVFMAARYAAIQWSQQSSLNSSYFAVNWKSGGVWATLHCWSRWSSLMFILGMI